MKHLLFYFLLIITSGCQFSSGTPNPSNTVDSATNTSSSVSLAEGCPPKPPGNSKNLETLRLGTQPVKVSGQVSFNENMAYTFFARRGQRLQLNNKPNDLCVWVYTPQNDLLQSENLPLSGNYAVQISVVGGTKSFDNLEISLISSQSIAAASSNKSPSPQPIQVPTLKPSSSFVKPSPESVNNLTQRQASQLIQNWLDSKSKIFAPPWNQDLLSQYITGPLYRDITKSGGSIDWLRSNSAYYTYKSSKVSKVWELNRSKPRPSIKVRIYEDRTLHGPEGKIDSNQSGQSTSNWIYYFVQENDNWKIYDFKEEG